MKRKLILEDGTVFIGQSFGWNCETIGEIVFNTSMTGYQEVITDPSNFGQMIVFSYPMIGNYGVNSDDFESIQPVVNAVIVKEACDYPSNWRNEMSLDDFLKQKKIPGLSGIDTRMLTRILRNKGLMKAAICHVDEDTDQVLNRLQSETSSDHAVSQLSTKRPYPCPGSGKNVVVIDLGVKHSILRELTKRHCNVTVVPYDTQADEILALNPDGVLLSNGPGNPKLVPEVIKTIQGLQGRVPLFAIGLGHQLFAMANGCEVKEMISGHRGSSYPTKNIKTGMVFFASENHGYEVIKETIDQSILSITYTSLNGDTVEGLEHQTLPAFSVQYQPEAAPGSEDGKVAIDQFMDMMNKHEGKAAESYAKKN